MLYVACPIVVRQAHLPELFEEAGAADGNADQ